MTAVYVSPFDDRVREPSPLAPRLPDIRGRRITLLDITKNRGDEFLTRLETRLTAAGVVTTRAAKEIFSRPAALGLIDQIASHSDAVIQALAD